ncbi:hypothetical protein ACWCRI_29465, partial [Streptomyces collinus]
MPIGRGAARRTALRVPPPSGGRGLSGPCLAGPGLARPWPTAPSLTGPCLAGPGLCGGPRPALGGGRTVRKGPVGSDVPH